MIYSFLYVFVFSGALILIQKLDLSIPPLFSLLVTVSIASLYFNFINRNSLKTIYIDCFKNKTQWFTVMLIVLVMWATTMIGPGKIGASLFNFIYFAWLGMLGLLTLSFKNWQENRSNFCFGMCLLALIAGNIFLELHSSLSSEAVFGIIMALIGGTSSFIYFKQSQSLAKQAHLTATQILAVRFYLSIFVLFIFLPKQHFSEYLTFVNSINLILLAFFSLIIPLYFSQRALERITSEQHAIINSLCPLITGILQAITFNDINSKQISIYFIYSLTIAIFYLINKNNKKMEYK